MTAIAATIVGIPMYHAIQPGRSDKTYCEQTPHAIYPNIEFREPASAADPALCPVCLEVFVAMKEPTCGYCGTFGHDAGDCPERPMEKCPGCDVVLPADDLIEQGRHMANHHPEIIAERRAGSARLDGWEDG